MTRRPENARPNALPGLPKAVFARRLLVLPRSSLENFAGTTTSMNTIFHFVALHGYSMLFAAVFARQIGLPVPANLFLLAAGAIAASGSLKMGAAVGLAVTACLLADWLWYEAGRWRGDRVLHFLQGFAPDPDAADQNARKTFARFGPSMLLVAKFLPGLDAVAPPLAGTSGTSRTRFLILEALGAGLWSTTYSALGYFFSHDLNRAVAFVSRMGTVLLAATAAAITVYIIHKLASSVRRKKRLWKQNRAPNRQPESNQEPMFFGRADESLFVPAFATANSHPSLGLACRWAIESSVERRRTNDTGPETGSNKRSTRGD